MATSKRHFLRIRRQNPGGPAKSGQLVGESEYKTAAALNKAAKSYAGKNPRGTALLKETVAYESATKGPRAKGRQKGKVRRGRMGGAKSAGGVISNPAKSRGPKLESGYAYVSSKKHPKEPQSVMVDAQDPSAYTYVGQVRIEGDNYNAFKVKNKARYYFQLSYGRSNPGKKATSMRRGRAKSAGAVHSNPGRGDAVSARELQLFIDNDAGLYHQMTTPIYKNLRNKMAAGKYNATLAVKAFMHLADEGARRYTSAHGSGRGMGIFDKPTRTLVARELAQEFHAEAKLGNYDELLFKKYQRKSNPGKAPFGSWPNATKTFSGKTYHLVPHAESLTKSDATKIATSLRAEGRLVRVSPTPGHKGRWSVYTRGAKKNPGRRAASALSNPRGGRKGRAKKGAVVSNPTAKAHAAKALAITKQLKIESTDARSFMDAAFNPKHNRKGPSSPDYRKLHTYLSRLSAFQGRLTEQASGVSKKTKALQKAISHAKAHSRKTIGLIRSTLEGAHTPDSPYAKELSARTNPTAGQLKKWQQDMLSELGFDRATKGLDREKTNRYRKAILTSATKAAALKKLPKRYGSRKNPGKRQASVSNPKTKKTAYQTFMSRRLKALGKRGIRGRAAMRRVAKEWSAKAKPRRSVRRK